MIENDFSTKHLRTLYTPNGMDTHFGEPVREGGWLLSQIRTVLSILMHLRKKREHF